MRIKVNPSLFATLAALGFCTAALAADEKLPETIIPPQAIIPPPAVLVDPACAAPERTVSKNEILIREHQSATTLPRLAIREVEVSRGPACTFEIAWHEERRTCTELALKPRDTIEEVTCMTVEPSNVIDPITGCAHTEYHQVPVVKRVRITVFELVPVEKHYLVKVPYIKPVEVTQAVKKLVAESITVPAVRKTLEGIPVPCEIPIPPPPCPIPGPVR